VNTINDGGPAFPQQPFIRPNGDMDWGTPGMSLHDWFAGTKQLTPFEMDIIDDSESSVEQIKLEVAIRTRYADAMIAEREKGKQ